MIGIISTIIAINPLKNRLNTAKVTIPLGNLKILQFASITGCSKYEKIKAITNGVKVTDIT